MIRAEISTLNRSKSCGPDEIHPIILKELSDFSIEPLVTIMNNSLRYGILPDDWKQATVADIYFDFAKAFDTVPHRRLLKKIESYGIHGNILKLINGFLSNRHKTVKFDGVASKEEVVYNGIPQGSVLGPLLFVIYINDLSEHVISQMYLFANHTKLMKKVRTKNHSVLLQNDIDGMLHNIYIKTA